MVRPLSPDDLARFPLPGLALPVEVAFSPDERVLTFLHSSDDSLERRLFVLDLDEARRGADPVAWEVPVSGAVSSETELSLEERLRRERLREVGLGVTSASWSKRADALLVPLPDGLHVLTGLSADPRAPRHVLAVAVADLPTSIVGPQLSPDGGAVAFVSGGELHVAGTDGRHPPRRLTNTGQDGLYNGLAEYVAQEEMDRGEGLWWSNDSALLAYAEVDERHVPLYRIAHQGSDELGPTAEEAHRYPFAGQANALVRLGVLAATGGETVWMDTGDPDQYLARVHWLDDGRLVAELESRDQTRLDVVAFDPSSGVASVLYQERCEPWVELHDDFRALRDGSFLWSSERSGYRHLELHSPSGELVAVLTSGEWQVDRLETVDEDAGIVYFTARADGPTERHLYSVPLRGGEITRLTSERGWHLCVVGTRSGTFVDRHGALDSPPAVRLRTLSERSVLAALHDRRDTRIDELELEPPELVTFPAEDGTTLFGLCFRSEGEPRGGGRTEAGASWPPPPLVVDVYGGPHAQRVVDDWVATVRMRAQAFRRLGYTVLVVDNRGSAGRGLEFVRSLHHHLGEIEVADQLCGVRWAVEQGLADPDRVGIYGWSYGGYMALRCLGAAPETFRAAVAGAPVTNFDGYDTHYTERYLGTPQADPTAYESSSVFGLVGSMRGSLLIVHGLIDENVHFRHTARLINHLIAQRKSYELLLFPEERHLPRREVDRAYMEERIVAFMLEALALPATSPA